MITRELIISTATHLFVTNGVKTVTIDKIVKELHTSKRTLYSHFTDKTVLLEACLSAYHIKVRDENDEIIEKAENVIEAMGCLQRKIITRAHQINPNFFSDILHYYPGVLSKSYKETGSFAHQQLLYLAEWGIEEGVFEENMDVEVVGKTVLSLLKLFKDNKQFSPSVFSKERLTFGILVPYLRGLCTLKGIELLAIEEEHFRGSI